MTLAKITRVNCIRTLAKRMQMQNTALIRAIPSIVCLRTTKPRSALLTFYNATVRLMSVTQDQDFSLDAPAVWI